MPIEINCALIPDLSHADVIVDVKPKSLSSTDQLSFGFKVVCDPDILDSIDFNFILVIILTLAIVFIAVKTPDFSSIKQIEVENLKKAEFKYQILVFGLLVIIFDKPLAGLQDTVPLIITIISIMVSFIAVKGVAEEFGAVLVLLLPCCPKSLSAVSIFRL